MILTDEDRERAARLRREAGLPPTITDPSVLAGVQALMRLDTRQSP